MQSTRDYMRKSGLAAAFALAVPLYASADLLPPPSDSTVSFAEYSDVGGYSMAQLAYDNLNQVGGPGSIENPIVGSPRSTMGRGAIPPAASGGAANTITPPRGGAGNNPPPSSSGAGGGLVAAADNTPSPSPTGGGSAGGPNVQVRGPALTPATNFLRNPGNFVAAVTGYCVDMDTGAAFNVGAAANDGDCGPNGYFVSGSPDTINTTEELDSPLSPDLSLANNIDDGETIGISDQFVGPSIQVVAVPEPGTLLLLGAGLLFLGTMRRRMA